MATPSFEETLRRLEAIVERLEEEDLTLEEALRLFEEGVQLIGRCQDTLAQAEQRVKILTERMTLELWRSEP